MLKPIAFYLPQFHSIPENDEWWGKGFTEWDNVKRSRPLFRGHNQPEKPLNHDYYCLLDKEVQIKQAKLAKEFGIYGFCYYHYWFEGKLLLEKPSEQMLMNQDIDVNFCFCWANESWARTWDGKEKKILIKQNYQENKEGWEVHFQYLLPFFKDKRYIKVNNKPLFLLYKPHLIKNGDALRECWNLLAKENGFSGIYWGMQHDSAFQHIDEMAPFDIAVEFEPYYTVNQMPNHGKQSFLQRAVKKIRRMPTIYNYDEIWKLIINRQPNQQCAAPGAFTSWDNTPRRGRKALIFWKAAPEKFEKYLTEKIIAVQNSYNSEFIFINAWNEWAEGAHLEASESDGYGYLEALKKALIRTGEYTDANKDQFS